MTRLSDVVSRSLIVCYKEDITELQAQMNLAGWGTAVLRGNYSSEELRCSSMTRCFMNHRNAWRIAAETPGYTLVCEADFVPCKRLGTLPVFWPLDNPMAWGYLYQGSPRLLSVVGSEQFLRGHSASVAAYIINQPVADILLRFFEYEMQEYGSEEYFNWDAHLRWWTMGRGAEAYIPERHYGEHGGVPNPEHAKFRISRAGWHQADNLVGPLAFLPQYARGSRLRLWLRRAEARALGWARLLTGRWVVDTNVYPRNWRRTLLMQWIGIRRLLPRAFISVPQLYRNRQ